VLYEFGLIDRTARLQFDAAQRFRPTSVFTRVVSGLRAAIFDGR